MSNDLYGKGTKKLLEKGKYRLALSGGPDPRSCGPDLRTGKVHKPGDDGIPDNALAVVAVVNEGSVAYERIKPPVKYGTASEEQKAAYSWQEPVKYLKHQETFLGTSRQADLRIEEIRRELKLERDLLLKGIEPEELSEHGISISAAVRDGMDADQVADRLSALKADVHTYASVSDAMLSHIEKYGKNRRTGRPLTTSTIKSYRGIEKHIVESFVGPMPICSITRADVLRFLDDVRDGGLGDTSACACLAQMSRVFKYARRNMLIASNPCDDLDISEKPVRPKPDRKPLSKDETRRIVSVTLSHEPTAHYVMVLLAACNGLRIGEVLGLSWSHVILDAPHPYAVIEQQHTALDGTHQTKTDERHIVPLDAITVDYLKRWAAIQSNELNAIGIERGIDTPICTSAAGTRINTNNAERWFRHFFADNGLGRFVDDDGRQVVELTVGDDATLYDGCIIMWRDADGWPCDAHGNRYSRTYKRPKIATHYEGPTPHCLRHTYFTRRLEDGLDLKTAQALGGWTTPDMLLRVYAHSVDEKVLSSGGYMDKLLSEATTQQQTI